jgi:predicted TIM-barrel fold metal-dependent hydrolase
MLVDINASVGHWPFKQLKHNTCPSLLERMNHFGIELSLISNLNGIFYKNTQPANEELYTELKSNRLFANRFIPFAVINPIYAGWRNDLEQSVRKFGMKGIRLYPAYHDYAITNPSCIELVKRARDLELPVALTMRMVDSRQRSWMDISEEWSLKSVIPLIKEVPDAKYLILNLANSMKLDATETEILKKTDFLFDTSGRSLTDPAEIIKAYGKDRLAFGTHSPFLVYMTGLLRIEALREDEADKETKELLRSGNAKRFLKI